MCSLISSFDHPPANDARTETPHDSGNYHPSIWGNLFLEDDSHGNIEGHISDAHMEQQVQQLKEQVRKMILDSSDTFSQKYNLIDTIHRLGLAYHFETEIKEALKRLSDHYHISCEEGDHDDPYTIALEFRLLRQHGYNVSCDAFKKFKDNEGDFKEPLISDVPEMLSLYEATYLRVHGEEILDEALIFTTTHLQSISNLSGPVADQVAYALGSPQQNNLIRTKISWSKLL